MGSTAALTLQAASLISNVGVQRQQANQTDAEGTYSAALASRQATDAIARGAQAESRFRTGTAGLMGAQRANASASGVDAGSGSAADVQGDTARLSELDALTIRNNAAREAWGYQTQGALTQLAAKNTASAQRANSASTLLTGGAQLYGAYKRSGISFGRSGGGTPDTSGP